MLKVYSVNDQSGMDRFISNTMSFWNGWMFAQPDCNDAKYPVKFVVVTEPNIKLATIQILN